MTYFLLLVKSGTYRGLVDGGEHTSRLNNVVSASITPLDLGRGPPEDGTEMEVRIIPQNQGYNYRGPIYSHSNAGMGSPV